MKMFYFVGGPKPGCFEEFMSRLHEIGGTPPDWTVYPHADKDGLALHLVQAGDISEIFKHLSYFADIYERGAVMEIVEKKSS